MRNVPIYFLQMFVILATCRFFGWLVRRWLHQPQVIGEMIAGEKPFVDPSPYRADRF